MSARIQERPRRRGSRRRLEPRRRLRGGGSARQTQRPMRHRIRRVHRPGIETGAGSGGTGAPFAFASRPLLGGGGGREARRKPRWQLG